MTEPIASPRIAVIALFGENTAFRTPLDPKGYPWLAYFEDEAGLIDAIADPKAFIMPETRGFFAGMDETGAWCPVPILYAMAASGPMLAEEHLQSLLTHIDTALAARAPFDGVYISGHGSFIAEDTRDTDGVLLARVRAVVGDAAPVVETLDLHGQVTRQMIDLADMLIAYRTDPHVDNEERGREAAAAMRRLLTGERPSVAYVRLPIMIPTVAIVAETSPFPGAVALGQELCDGVCANVSILPGYPFTDTPDAGMHVVVSSWDDGTKANEVARAVGEKLWNGRKGFAADTIDLDAMQSEMRALMADPARPAACFADIADNPGGGGTANTTYALEAMLACDGQAVAIGPFWEPNAAAAAHAAGVGAELDLVLNAGFDDRFAKPLAVKARVLALSDGIFTARLGPAKGVGISQQDCAALAIGGITLVVTTLRLQALAVEQFEILGVDIAACRAVVVKSRGHYQTSFGEFVARDRMIAIDAPGWMSPRLDRLDYRNIPRPLFPLDQDAAWDGRLTYLKRRAPSA